tara:strand:+ start:232 stop:363 length:132 start_codon:yes stop_codon:yes gene_type:complete
MSLIIIEPAIQDAPALPTSFVFGSTATIENVSCDNKIEKILQK